MPAPPTEPEPVLEPLDEDEPEDVGTADPDPGAPVRKKKKKAEARTREEVDAAYDQWLQRSRWRKRIFRGSAFVVLGLVIIAGATYLLVLNDPDIKPVYSVLFLLTGLAAVGKGLIGLFFGQFFGEE